MSLHKVSNFSIGQTGYIVQINSVIRHQLLEMGLTRGAKITLIRKAPLGDPLEIEVRGYRLSIRKSEAETIITGNEEDG